MCFVVCMQGCYSKYTIPPEEFKRKPEHNNVTIQTTDGAVYEFNRSVRLMEDEVVGYANDSAYVKIPIEDVESVRVIKYDAGKTTWCVLGVIGVFGLVLGALLVYKNTVENLQIDVEF
ncbi:hypothetical protein AMJ87_08295 [candidate division WOR_3 bacterium SM23_60]|uniref:Uncharacterized protein n=1 Tax=candidate division WOR_3 bacterium SM23_60 TaxID=1703780 RepID=A0A0S8GCP3_UNCW3|nr:MAG: hypothetical protein AMJ87_08295 [candidate division WOR_3 bacterium SM23_60]